MALVLKRLYHGYFWLFRDMADPRTDGTLLASSPLVPLAITTAYLYIVLNLGPKLMENRKPFNIKNIIRVYNVIQIVSNAYVSISALKTIYNFNRHCAPIDYSNSPEGQICIHVGYIFYVLKILDLMDTIFYVLRKSYRQISFLHIYHHYFMVFCLWIGYRYVAGGEGAWLPAVNGLVHVVMYLYYLLATIDDKWKDVKYKKMLTQMQLLQFLWFIYIFGRIFFISDCAYPTWISYLFIPQNVFMLFLFGDFYIKTYVRKNK